jgi:hypothetical protein
VLQAFKPADHERALREYESAVKAKRWPPAVRARDALRSIVNPVIDAADRAPHAAGKSTTQFLARYRAASDALLSGMKAQLEADRLTAQQIYAAYQANEIAADGLFKGKTVEFAGNVRDIGKDVLGSPYLTLETGSEAWGSLQAMFPRSSESQLASISKGQRVILQCRCDGKIMLNVILRDCSFHRDQ